MPESEPTQIVASSGNVFADLGVPDAAELHTKARLCAALARIVDRHGLTQAEIALALGINQSKVSALLHHNSKASPLSGSCTSWSQLRHPHRRQAKHKVSPLRRCIAGKVLLLESRTAKAAVLVRRPSRYLNELHTLRHGRDPRSKPVWVVALRPSDKRQHRASRVHRRG